MEHVIFSIKLYILSTLARLFDMSWVVPSPDIVKVGLKLIPYVLEMEKEGNRRGWNGTSKRQVLLNRVKVLMPDIEMRDRDWCLAIEYAVRRVL